MLRLLSAFVLGAAVATALASAPRQGHVQPTHSAPAREAPSGKVRVGMLASKDNGGAQSAFLGMLEMDPGAAVPEHRDPTEEFIYILEGGGELHIDDQTFTVGPGDAIYMPADALVSFQARADTPTHALQVFAPAGPESKYDAWKPVQGH